MGITAVRSMSHILFHPQRVFWRRISRAPCLAVGLSRAAVKPTSRDLDK
jgi:hypothetical protein